jgi:hypothetical protein
VLLAISANGDPMGSWNFYRFDANAADTHWADYGSIGYNKDWIAISVNMFANSNNAFLRAEIHVFGKPDAYDGGGLVDNVLIGPFNPGNPGGFTLAPAVTHDNTVATLYLVENWNPTFGLLRVSKITGTPPALPVITAGLTYPQSPNGWIGSGRIPSRWGFSPQSGTPNYIEANDARVQNVIYRNGSLWVAHTVFLGATTFPAGGPANTAVRTGAQWWQLNAGIENSTVSSALQRGIVEDTTANNCHAGGGALVGGCVPTGFFYAFPTIAVNQDNDVMMGTGRFGPSVLPQGAYVYRDSADAANTMRDPHVFKTSTGFYDPPFFSTNRWGDYSWTHPESFNDCDFWTTQEYSPVNNNWGTWYAKLDNPGGCTDKIFDYGFEAGATNGLVPFTAILGSPTVSNVGPVDRAFSLLTTASGTAGVSVQKSFPVPVNELFGSFMVNTNNFDPGMANNRFRVRIAINFGTGLRMAVIVLRRRPADGFALHARGRRDDTTRWQTAFYLVTDGVHTVKYHWRRSSAPGANNGLFEFYIDGVLRETVSLIDNDLIPIDAGRVGISSAKVGINGTLKFDKVIYNRLTLP